MTDPVADGDMISTTDWIKVVELATSNSPEPIEWDDITPEEVIELAQSRQVRAYQKRTKSGGVVQVAGYVRTDHSATTDRAKSSPGRPKVAAASGRFPGDRAIPVWPDAGKNSSGVQGEEAEEYEGIEETGEVDQETLDKDVPVAVEILSNMPPNPALNKLVGILKGLTTATLSGTEDTYQDLEVLELASRRGIVRVTGYSYVSKKTGKVIRVNPYTQIRRLISAMGGLQMAAKRGVTPDLLDAALPGYQIKGKVFKAKEVSNKGPRTRRVGGRSSTKQILSEINSIPVDRSFNVPKPSRDGKDMVRAMSTAHPLESVRNSREGSRVTRGNESWIRGMDGLWHKTPRRNNKGLDDKALTQRLISKEGRVDLTVSSPTPRKRFEGSVPDYGRLDQNSTNYTSAARFTKALEPTYQNLPEGIADSLNGNLDVRRDSRQGSTSHSKMTSVSTTRTNNFYPKLRVHTNPEYEKDLMTALPRQQREGYSAPSTLHPTETMMARATSPYVEELFKRRAPADMTDRMYDRLNRAYDKTVKNDEGDYSALRGREGWDARMTSSSRSPELRQELRDNLSFSALSSPEDFLAEAWVEYVGSPEPRPLSKELGEAFQAGMEEFSDYLFKNKWFDASEIPERVYERTVSKDVSRRVSDVVDGAEDRTVETNLAPPNLRSVLINSSKYVDIRDENGNPLFDAEIVREGDRVTIDTLSLPMSNPEDMPTGVPRGIDYVTIEDNARYYSTPLEDLKRGPSNQKFFADQIDMEKSLKAIEAVEETSFYEGVRRFDVNAKAGQDSVLYAHAGYQFDPDTTDVQEISNILNDLQEVLTYTGQDASEGYWPIPKNVRASMTRKLNQWQSNLSDHPDTWPLPKDIADLGKYDAATKSMGESILTNYSWDGVKQFNDSSFKPWSSDALNLPDPDSTPDVPRVPRGDSVSASTVGNVARSLDSDSKDLSSVDNMMRAVSDRHKDLFPDVKTEVTGTGMSDHRAEVISKDGEILVGFSVSKKSDGSLRVSDLEVHPSDPNAAILAFDIMDSFESSYRQSNTSTRLVRAARESDPIGNYVLASEGYDWDQAPPREQLQAAANSAIETQVQNYRQVLEGVIARRASELSTEDMYRMQEGAEKTVLGFRESLQKQANSVLAKYDDDPLGPTPFEISQLGKRESFLIEDMKIRGNLGDPSLDYQTLQRIERLGSPFLDPRDVKPHDRKDRIDEGGILDAMTNLDGDPSRNTHIEFLGKQMLTLGTYDMAKTLQGFWNWATDSYKPTARKAAVGLLFLLIRLMPASIFRGAMLATVSTIAKRSKSPNPQDWPSVAEIHDAIDEIEKYLPDVEV